MKRSLTMGALGACVVLSIGLYLVEHEVQELERELDDLDHAVVSEQRTIQVLRAEWSYLNQPQRLQELAAYLTGDLGLQAVMPDQIGTISDLPLREVSPDAPVPAYKPAPPARLLVADARRRA